MVTTYEHPFIGDKPRHYQSSVVKDLSLTQVGWIASNAGVISAAGNINPPQFFVTNAGDPQVYRLQCPKGNPDNCYTFFSTDEGIVAYVDDYSTLVEGFLIVNLATAPAGNVRIRGLVGFGRNASEVHGGVEAPPEYPKDLKAHGQFCVYGLLRELMLYPLGWITDGAGDVTQTAAPHGCTVEHTGAGEYTVQFPCSFPGLQNRWVDLFANSIGQGASFAYPGGAPQRVVITLDADMGDGERTSVTWFGSVTKYPNNYGGASGGVHSDLISRDIHNYGHTHHRSPLRNSTFIPIRAILNTTGIGSASRLAPSTRLIRVSPGVYTLYIGKFKEDGIVGALSCSDGEAIGVTAVDGAAGTITLTRPSGDPAGPVTLGGYIIALYESNL